MDKKIVYKTKSIFYRVEGNGIPVVLIHGVPADGSLWNNQIKFLSDSYRSIVPDMPGSGRSELTDDVSMEALADTIKAILEAESVNEVIIIGHSMGGYTSIAFAEKYPELVKALGLFHSSSFADTEEKKASRKKNISFINKHGSYEFIKQSIPGLFSDGFKKEHSEVVESILERYKNFHPDSLAAYQQSMMNRSDRRKVLEEIVKPVLFVIGEYDKAIPFADSVQQCHIPELSYIEVFRNSGHMGMLEEIEKTNQVLKKFLDDASEAWD